MSNDTIYDDEFSANSKKPQKLIKETKVDVTHLEKSVEAKTRELDITQKNLVNIYKDEPKVPVRVAPAYAKYFGRVMRVSINGISVAVKCDGSTVQLPESFAAEVMRRMTEMDKIELRQSKMSNVQKNLETTPGQINFFG